METNLLPSRWRQIAIANFDYYVSTRLAEPSWVITNDGIDHRDLCNLAEATGCNAEKLCSLIVASLIRSTKNDQLILNEIQEDGEKKQIILITFSEKEEDDIIKKILKFSIKESTISLPNVKRKLGHMPHILNHQNANLKVSIQELSVFIKPLYKEVIDETLTF
jgi:hypothetical protein